MVASTGPVPAEESPKDYDYSHPTLNCDMVMKGGITSGIVYPLAICEIAKTYRFRNVGGTSAGAIAAATAAAAELGRNAGGFARLAALPEWLGTKENLFHLFQPQKRTRRLYAILAASIKTGGGRLENVLKAAVWGFLPLTLAAMLPGLALLILLALSGSGLLLVWGIACALLLTLVGALISLGLQVWCEAKTAIPRNFFGLCSGAPGWKESRKALTPWLADQLDLLAGKAALSSDCPQTEPLTFGDLWGATAPAQGGDRAINLEMMTTNLTQGRGYRLPFDSPVWFFDEGEFAQLFPARVVQWMVEHPPNPPEDLNKRRGWELLCKLLEPRRPLPDAVHLPVIVAARLSLSFPLVISAIPLWSIDWSRRQNDTVWRLWKAWLSNQKDTWESIRDHPEAWHATPSQRPYAGRCWFSDGGITNNFPVHFFDAPIPRWPTFALNLRPFHPDYPETLNECENVWMPKCNQAGTAEWWVPITSLSGFVRSIFDTLQNWETNTQLHVPGYRDRVAHIELADKEGGMNLTMSWCLIKKLSERGRCAGEKLSRRFDTGDGTELTWDNHRWVRYRSTMELLEGVLRAFSRAYQNIPPVGQPYPELIARSRGVPPTSYEWRDQKQETFAADATMAIRDLGLHWDSSERSEPPGPSFTDGAPRPTPEIRIKPRI